MIDFELESYAVNENNSRGREYNEVFDDSKYRSVFGKDRDRVINSSAFRRLQYKTQVFVNHKGDHYRTRLTHSIEVAQIARWIAGALKVNKDLAEIVSLVHDLGHTPFGHAGEIILDQKIRDFTNNELYFSHNQHSLKLITKLENRFIEFEGLNLSWEMLEGVAKHNGPIKLDKNKESYIKQFNSKYDLDLRRFPSIEAQISSISDDIAYNNHDIEDGLRANLFEKESLIELPIVGKIYKDLMNKYPHIKHETIVGEAKKRLTLKMVVDVIEETKRRIKAAQIHTEEDVRNQKELLVGFSPQMQQANQAIKVFLTENVYRHYNVNIMTTRARKIISRLFDFLIENPSCLPYDNETIKKITDNKKKLAIFIVDYIAGMTDRYAINEYEKLILLKKIDFS